MLDRLRGKPRPSGRGGCQCTVPLHNRKCPRCGHFLLVKLIVNWIYGWYPHKVTPHGLSKTRPFVIHYDSLIMLFGFEALPE